MDRPEVNDYKIRERNEISDNNNHLSNIVKEKRNTHLFPVSLNIKLAKENDKR